AWPSNLGQANLESYQRYDPKIGVVAKQFTANPAAVETEIQNLRQVKLLIDEGKFQDSRWVIMPRAPGVHMWKLDFLTKHWGLDNNSKNLKDCETALNHLLTVTVEAAILVAKKHMLLN
ncbi:hypothetical protein DXG03_001637, partial [Asterophora parasitica]